MVYFKAKIADFVFEINTMYQDTKNMCLNYLTDEDSCFSISINQEDIEYERQKSIEEAKLEGLVYQNFSDSYLETISVYRKIAEYICEHQSAVFHGSLISLDNEGYLFTGRSGIGKTTHVNNWLKKYSDTKIINGDKPILKIEDDKVVGYGTPWSGKENLNTNDKVTVKAIIFVTRDTVNHIEEVKAGKFLPKLLSQTYRSNKPNGIAEALNFSIEVSQRVKLYKLGCNMDIDSAKAAYEGINK